MEPAVRARITSKGQVTLPKTLRDALNLKKASIVEFDIRDGEAVMRPAGGGFLKRFGTVTPRRKPEDWARVREQARDSIATHRGEKRR
ncbi:MAG: AbrB/MazE/SpoVT family DNA-binding domain-containing protein [Chloroflexi bacterium]|nr:AbrB/MazE/SpoVT family DNA-binding domain-containing protein [Chloroflexota bacterium]